MHGRLGAAGVLGASEDALLTALVACSENRPMVSRHRLQVLVCVCGCPLVSLGRAPYHNMPATCMAPGICSGVGLVSAWPKESCRRHARAPQRDVLWNDLYIAHITAPTRGYL